MARSNTFLILIGVASIGVVFLLMGNGTEEYTSAQGNGTVSAGEQQVVRTETGNEFSLTLPVYTEGYEWQPIFNDTYVTLEDTDEGDQEVIFTFEAQLQGATEVSFVYKSGDGDIAEEHSARIEIR